MDFTCFHFCAILLLLLTIVVLAGFYKQESVETQAEESHVEEKKKECGQKRKAKSHYNDVSVGFIHCSPSFLHLLYFVACVVFSFGSMGFYHTYLTKRLHAICIS